MLKTAHVGWFALMIVLGFFLLMQAQMLAPSAISSEVSTVAPETNGTDWIDLRRLSAPAGEASSTMHRQWQVAESDARIMPAQQNEDVLFLDLPEVKPRSRLLAQNVALASDAINVRVSTKPSAVPPVNTPKTATATALSNTTIRANNDKWIDVNISKQTITAYAGSRPVKSVLVSTGTAVHPTVVGRYAVDAKLPAQTMTGGSRARDDYYRLPAVPNIMYFYLGYAIHGTYWHHNFGHPMSHGCVNLTLADAKWFYDWTPIGTLVVTHY